MLRVVFGAALVVGLLAAVGRAAETAAAGPAVSEWIAALNANDEPARMAAMHHLGQLHDAAAAAVPALADLLKDPSPAIRAEAAVALGEIGKSAKGAAAALVQAVADDDLAVRRSALEALGKIRPGPRITLPLFVRLLRDADPSARNRAMQAIVRVGEPAVPFLIEGLKHEKAAYWSLLVIRDMGATAKAAVPALIEAMDDKRPEIRREAILALAEMGEAAKPAYPALLQALGDKDTAAAATYAFARLGDLPPDARQKISENRQAADPVLRATSLWALARGTRNKAELEQASAALMKLLMDPEPRVRTAAAHALADLKPGPDITLPLFKKAIEQGSDEAVRGMLDAIAQLGDQALPALSKALDVAELRPKVAHILGEMGEKAGPDVERLDDLLKDENPVTRDEAVMALAKIGPAATDAIPELIESLAGSDESLAIGAAYALGRIGPAAKEAVPSLSKALESQNASLAMFSANALASIDGSSAEVAAKAVPVLVESLHDPDANFRLEAVAGLKAWGKLAAPARQALETATHDKSADVRAAAADALQAL